MPEGELLHAEGEGLEWVARWWCRHAWRIPQGSHRRCCALQEGKPIKECAREVKQCEGLRNAYSACKRGQLDARSRLRGNRGY